MNPSPDAPVAIVTGAARGLGRCFAEHLGAAGHTVVGWDVEFPEPVPFATRRVDITDEAAVGDAVEAAPGGVGVLVNNAGINAPAPTAELSLETWHAILAVNLTGALICARAVADAMRGHGRGGAIVNIASIAALVGTTMHSSIAYAASKGGLVAMTRALAVEWAGDGIAVNAVAPGMIETELTRSRLERPDYREAVHARTPSDTLVTIDDVARGVVYLAGERSSSVTGQVLVIDGGWTAA